jgi:hypothetical protein
MILVRFPWPHRVKILRVQQEMSFSVLYFMVVYFKESPRWRVGMALRASVVKSRMVLKTAVDLTADERR